MSHLLRNTFAALVLASSPILATISAPGIAWAQEEAGDPPADVARVAAISGTVSTHQPGSQDWDQAQQNYPLAPGSGVWADARSHAAVDVAGARVHLDGSSALEITAINQGQVQLSVPQGAAYVHVYPGVQGVNFEIDTPHGAAYINQPGQYEIVAGDDQHPSSLSVIEGQAQFVGQSTNLALQQGQRGNITPDNQSGVDQAQPDDFVRLVQQSEQPYQQQMAQTAQYVSPQQTGYQDLARYGDWSQAPQYGAVWYPQQVPANWAPYRYGHWAYVQPWGWTWVDDQPWGFTPFHYGRWVQVGHRWGWVPGERAARPVYAPALVSFFDLGGGVGINLSLGWVPLAPEEVFVPYYRHGPRYVREVNITNVRNETTIINVVNRKTVINYNNYRNYRDATSVRRDVMTGGRPVGPEWSKHDNAQAAQQWQHAKPKREVAFQPQANQNEKHGNGPKSEPQVQQHQNWKLNNNQQQPTSKPANPPKFDAQQGPSQNGNRNTTNRTNGEPGQPNGKWKPNNPQPTWKPQDQVGKPSMGQPKNAVKPNGNAPAPIVPPVNGAAQPAKQIGVPTAPQSSGDPSKWTPKQQQEQTSKKVQQQPQWKQPNQPQVQAAKPVQPPKPQQQQWKQQNKPQVQTAKPAQQPKQQQQQWKQQDQQHSKQQQHAQPAQQQKAAPQQKPLQNCGQQQGACQQ